MVTFEKFNTDTNCIIIKQCFYVRARARERARAFVRAFDRSLFYVFVSCSRIT